MAIGVSWFLLAFLLLPRVGGLVSPRDSMLSASRWVITYVLAITGTGCFLAVQLRRLNRYRSRLDSWLVWGLALNGLVLIPVGNTWSTLGMALAGIMLNTEHGVRGAATTLALAAAGILAAWWATPDPFFRLLFVCVTWLSATLLYSLSRLALALRDLRLTRLQVARLSVDAERERITGTSTTSWGGRS